MGNDMNNGWIEVWNTDRKIGYANEVDNDTIEVWYEIISGKRHWFVAVADEESIRDAEFPDKKAAVERAIRFMNNHPKDDISDAYPSMEQGSGF